MEVAYDGLIQLIRCVTLSSDILVSVFAPKKQHISRNIFCAYDFYFYNNMCPLYRICNLKLNSQLPIQYLSYIIFESNSRPFDRLRKKIGKCERKFACFRNFCERKFWPSASLDRCIAYEIFCRSGRFFQGSGSFSCLQNRQMFCFFQLIDFKILSGRPNFCLLITLL